LRYQPTIVRQSVALYLSASCVVSTPVRSRAVVDAGLKAFSFDSGPPLTHGCADAEYTKASDEHGVLRICDDRQLALNERLWLVPGHCDPTVNLYDSSSPLAAASSKPSGRSTRAARWDETTCFETAA
jgi:D-serine deaminase-like pyridoxal phosphate-dependent protein